MMFEFCFGILPHSVYWEAKKYISSGEEKFSIVFIPVIRRQDADMVRTAKHVS
jgi:hypothetical protein